ncbi:MAG: sigma-70 family RNA polymerase sigma factor, partial [Gemmataceae bacterium]
MIGDPKRLVEQLRRIAPGSGPAIVESELLAQFLAGDGEAFPEIVRRLGPMVLGVCRRLLGNGTDADDAFQATFLVLAQRAGNVRRGAPLAGWLHGVAYHVALKARAAAARRRLIESSSPPRPAAAATDVIAMDAERSRILDDELRRLPAGDRELLLRCDLDGDTHATAAAAFGYPLGSVARRLDRARSRLRSRLVRRGVTLAAVSLAVAPTDALADAATRLAQLAALGSPLPPGPATLARSALRGFAAARARLGVTAGLVACLLTVAVAAVARQTPPPVASSPKLEPAQRAPADRDDDPLPEGAVARLGTQRFRHDFNIFGTAVSADGRLIATTSGAGVWLWDAATGRRLHILPCRDQILGGVAISPDGRTVAALGNNRTLNRWEIATGTELEQHRISNGPMANQYYSPFLAYTADGKNLIVKETHDKVVRVFDASSIQERPSFPAQSSSLSRVALSANGARLAVSVTNFDSKSGEGRNSEVTVLDVKTREALRGWTELGGVSALALSPDGATIVTGSGDGVLRARDAVSGRELRALKWEQEAERKKYPIGGYWSVAISPDGRLVAAHTNVGTRVWELASFKDVQSWSSQQEGHLQFLPNSRTLVFSGNGLGHTGHAVRFFDALAGKEVRVFDGHYHLVTAAAFTPDGQTIITGSQGGDGALRAWSSDGRLSGRTTESWALWATALAVSPDGRTVATPEGWGIGFWDLATWTQQKGISFRSSEPGQRALAAAYTPDGKQLVSADYSGIAHVTDLSTQQTRTFRIHPATAWGAALSADARVIAAAGQEDRLVYLWDVATGNERRRFERTVQGSVRLALSSDGRLLAAGDGAGQVQLWDSATGQALGHFDRAGILNALTFSPDGTILAAGYDIPEKQEHMICRWDLATGAELPRWTGHRGSIQCLVFSPDGTRLVSGSYDTTALVWGDASPKSELTAEQREMAFGALAGDAVTAFCAAALLVRDRDRAVALLKQRLRPSAKVDSAKVAALAGQFDSPQFAARDKAARELERLGPEAAGDLR